ncbi:308_t:CDS:1, partial [Scutellospora calospora]
KYLSDYPENTLNSNTPSLDQIKIEFQLIKTSLNYQQKQTTYNNIKQKIEN